MKTNEQNLLIFLGIITFLVISGCTEKQAGNFSGEITQRHNPEKNTEPALVTNETTMKNNYQEVRLHINADGYSPDVIIAKVGVPLKINITSDIGAGCATEIVFPGFNITRTVPAGMTDVIEIMPSQEGTFDFRCSMDMYRGKLVITK